MSYLLFWLTMVPESILFVSVSGSDWDLVQKSLIVCLCVCVCVFEGVCVCVYMCMCKRERFYLKNYTMSYLLFWLTMVPQSILFVGVSCSDWDLIQESLIVCVYVFLCGCECMCVCVCV